jgi:hypothetical protein
VDHGYPGPLRAQVASGSVELPSIR